MSSKQAFGIWITGLPASGKSTITRHLVGHFHTLGISPAVLESDALREILTPEPTYSPAERDRFYEQMVRFGAMITRCSVPVIFDATANRRAYRDLARSLVPRYLEVFVDTPLEQCKARDPKGIYRAAAEARSFTVPGIQEAYERPNHPDLHLDGRDDPSQNAARIVEKARSAGYL